MLMSFTVYEMQALSLENIILEMRKTMRPPLKTHAREAR